MKTIKYQKGEEPFIFSDAIVLSDDDALNFSDQEIDNIKEARYNKWLLIVKPASEESVVQSVVFEEKGSL